MLRSSKPELAVEKSGLAKSNVSINEFGVDEQGKGLSDEAGLFCIFLDVRDLGVIRSGWRKQQLCLQKRDLPTSRPSATDHTKALQNVGYQADGGDDDDEEEEETEQMCRQMTMSS